MRLWRWLRWAFTGLISVASPLPWLVDVTSARYDALEDRVAKLERTQMFCLVTVTRDTCSWLVPGCQTQ